MKSLLTTKTDRNPAIELSDLLLAPSSILRLTTTILKDTSQKPQLPQVLAQHEKEINRFAPYIAALAIESLRAYGYYKLAEIAITKYF